MSGFANDYVEVAERISQFFAKYPEGSIRCGDATVVTIDGRAFISVVAEAYRTAADRRPSRAQAWEPFPGKTSFTKDSEAMNAETSAVGRALANLGIATKRSIATKEDVARRRAERDDGPAYDATASGRQHGGRKPIRDDLAEPSHNTAGERGWDHPITEAQLAKLGALMKGQTREQALAIVASVVGRDVESRKDLSKREASALIDALSREETTS